MKLLAIDPGPTQSAWLVYDTSLQKMCDWRKDDNDAVRRMLRTHDAGLLAVEMIASYGMAVGKDVFETCVWIGRFTECWVAARGQSRGPIRITRKQVALHVCNSPRANDANLHRALIDRFGPKGTKKDPGPLYGLAKDGWAALGVAVTAAEEGGL